ncbi:MAG: hypothetical protein ACD_75C00436G0002, partial [uncultured bacterium]
MMAIPAGKEKISFPASSFYPEKAADSRAMASFTFSWLLKAEIRMYPLPHLPKPAP